MLSGPSFYDTKRWAGAKPTCLVVLCHGYGANGNGMISLAEELKDCFERPYFIAPNAPLPYEYAQNFGDDSGDGSYQWYSLDDRSRESLLRGSEAAAPLLNSFIDEKLAELSLTGEDLYMMGFSQGCMISLHVGLRRKLNPPKAIVGFSGTLIAPEELSSENISYPKVCLIHGSDDEVVSSSLGRVAAQYLRKVGVETSFHLIPGLAHYIDSRCIEVASEFLAQ